MNNFHHFEYACNFYCQFICAFDKSWLFLPFFEQKAFAESTHSEHLLYLFSSIRVEDFGFLDYWPNINLCVSTFSALVWFFVHMLRCVAVFFVFTSGLLRLLYLSFFLIHSLSAHYHSYYRCANDTSTQRTYQADNLAVLSFFPNLLLNKNVVLWVLGGAICVFHTHFGFYVNRVLLFLCVLPMCF